MLRSRKIIPIKWAWWNRTTLDSWKTVSTIKSFIYRTDDEN